MENEDQEAFERQQRQEMLWAYQDACAMDKQEHEVQLRIPSAIVEPYGKQIGDHWEKSALEFGAEFIHVCSMEQQMLVAVFSSRRSAGKFKEYWTNRIIGATPTMESHS